MRSLVLVLGVLLACGGKAVVDGPPGGSGGNGTSTSTSTGVGATGPSAATTGSMTTGAGGDSHCGPACLTLDECGIDPAACEQSCATAAAPACVHSQQQWLGCLVDAMAMRCAMPSECVSPLRDWLGCEGWSNGVVGCGGGPGGSCDCFGDVGGIPLQTSCSGGPGASNCDCFVGGAYVGRCNHPSGDASACDLHAGCCATLFFVP